MIFCTCPGDDADPDAPETWPDPDPDCPEHGDAPDPTEEAETPA